MTTAGASPGGPDREARDRFFEEQLRRLFGVLLVFLQRLAHGLGLSRDTAEEVHAEVLFRAWKHRDRYNPHQGSLLNWLKVIGRRLLIDTFRRQRRLRCSDQEHLQRLEGHEAAAEELLAEKELRVRFDQFLAGLRPRDRLVWELTEAGVTHEAVAALLNLPLGTVGTIRSRVRRAFRKALRT
jgi:RNA polymerase sigma-70 factor (ECF subfamily)